LIIIYIFVGNGNEAEEVLVDEGVALPNLMEVVDVLVAVLQLMLGRDATGVLTGVGFGVLFLEKADYFEVFGGGSAGVVTVDYKVFLLNLGLRVEVVMEIELVGVGFEGVAEAVVEIEGEEALCEVFGVGLREPRGVVALGEGVEDVVAVAAESKVGDGGCFPHFAEEGVGLIQASFFHVQFGVEHEAIAEARGCEDLTENIGDFFL
jgi:hypothetical protein